MVQYGTWLQLHNSVVRRGERVQASGLDRRGKRVQASGRACIGIQWPDSSRQFARKEISRYSTVHTYLSHFKATVHTYLGHFETDGALVGRYGTSLSLLTYHTVSTRLQEVGAIVQLVPAPD